eukprot:CAMPEP_0195306280 /NCGR_PEP_ID=MMETSP0707-20130614/37118_1 /TAXON_ID=33640 /ORGANISM="Asterionellopsis glacialis, Strain CCMP134" /LENGTH=163 /DNA_ID=CAMNT_0040370493 /DNA_START=928 /DNA_END=1419 /DNA_ORIENTATION=+
MEAWSQRSEVKATKSRLAELVTETDQRCEGVVMDLLHEKFPHHKTGEETTGSDKYEFTNEPTWTIDPIDGTTKFVHRLALSCVIIASMVKKEVLVVVVYDPLADEVFWAHKDNGGRTSCAPIYVSATDTIPQGVISMDPGHGRDYVAVQRYCAAQSAILLHEC